MKASTLPCQGEKNNLVAKNAILLNFSTIYLYDKILGPSNCALVHWEYIEKWLKQFWNQLLMAGKIGNKPFPEFFSVRNNSKYCSILGVFSVLWAPKKVIDTVLESSTHGDQS